MSGDPNKALANVRKAAQRREDADTTWRLAIRVAHESGCTLRQIADAAGVTNPRIHQILNEQGDDDAS
jgi:hypothetical protein